MKKTEVAQYVKSALDQLNYQYLSDHDGAAEIFPIIKLTYDEKGVVVVTERDQRFEVIVLNEEDQGWMGDGTDESRRHDAILERLRKIPLEKSNDNGHQEADELILEFAPPDIREAYKKIERWFE